MHRTLKLVAPAAVCWCAVSCGFASAAGTRWISQAQENTSLTPSAPASAPRGPGRDWLRVRSRRRFIRAAAQLWQTRPRGDGIPALLAIAPSSNARAGAQTSRASSAILFNKFLRSPRVGRTGSPFTTVARGWRSPGRTVTLSSTSDLTVNGPHLDLENRGQSAGPSGFLGTGRRNHPQAINAEKLWRHAGRHYRLPNSFANISVDNSPVQTSTLDVFDGQPTIHGPLDIIKFLLWPIVGKTGYREDGAFAGVAAAIQTSSTAGYPLYMGGLRFGRMWNRHLEVMFEPIPALFLKQNSGRFNYAYGLYGGWRYYFVAVNPNRTWRFEPYVDLLGGIFNSIRKLPTDGSVFSFSAEGGIGARTFVAPHFSLEAGVRVVHISDAHIARHNPSYNGVMGYVGLMYVW